MADPNAEVYKVALDAGIVRRPAPELSARDLMHLILIELRVLNRNLVDAGLVPVRDELNDLRRAEGADLNL